MHTLSVARVLDGAGADAACALMEGDACGVSTHLQTVKRQTRRARAHTPAPTAMDSATTLPAQIFGVLPHMHTQHRTCF